MHYTAENKTLRYIQADMGRLNPICLLKNITSPLRVIWEERVADDQSGENALANEGLDRARTFAQLYATKSPSVTVIRPKFTTKTAPSLRRSIPPSNTPTP